METNRKNRKTFFKPELKNILSSASETEELAARLRHISQQIIFDFLLSGHLQ